jgi:hypothetical protein
VVIRFGWSSFLGAGALLLVGCGNSARKPVAQATSSLSLRVAMVEPGPRLLVTCRGGAFCRESAFMRPTEEEDAIAEAKEDCSSRGGQLGDTPCSRTAAVATCSGSGPSGPTTVVAYADEAADKMADLCDSLGGTFARRSAGE